MIRSMFSGVAGLRTHQSKMDVIGNNIANVNTAGFKAGRAVFQESIYQTTKKASAGNDVYGGSNPSQVGYGSQLASIDVNHGTSNYEPTGYGTDCMIDGGGYFLVGPKVSADGGAGGGQGGGGVNNTPNVAGGQGNTVGVTSLYLTRVGKFSFDGNGYLVDANKNFVYGFRPDEAVAGTTDIMGDDGLGEPDVDAGGSQTYGELKPIRICAADDHAIDDETPANDLMTLSDISIDENGVVSGTGPDGQVYKLGIVAVANVPNPNALEKAGNSYYKAKDNTGDVVGFVPGYGTTGLLMSNGLEMANVDLATEFSNMITTQRGFQANSKIITVSDQMLEELINMKR